MLAAADRRHRINLETFASLHAIIDRMASFADINESLERALASVREAEVERAKMQKRIDELESELNGLRQTQTIIDAEVERMLGK